MSNETELTSMIDEFRNGTLQMAIDELEERLIEKFGKETDEHGERRFSELQRFEFYWMVRTVMERVAVGYDQLSMLHLGALTERLGN